VLREVRPARPGLLRVCAHAPEAADGSDLTGLRVLLTADLLMRAAELGGLQVLTVLACADPSSARVAALERASDALGIHPSSGLATPRDAEEAAGGPIDVLLTGNGLTADSGQAGLVAWVGPAYLRSQDPQGVSTAEDAPAAFWRDPIAVRLALLSRPYHEPADLTEDVLADAGETLGQWRHWVAEWAESPSRPVPARFAETAHAAFADLDTVSAVALVRGLASDPDVPAGVKFETFVYVDRVLGLDLPRDIGRTGLPGSREFRHQPIGRSPDCCGPHAPPRPAIAAGTGIARPGAAVGRPRGA
jgi:hypothetical protein